MSLRPENTVTDFAGLNALKAKAAGNGRDPETLRAVARQFEALLMQQVLKSARAAGLGDDLGSGPGADTYKDLFDQQMAQQLSAGRGLGIADQLVRQLSGQQGKAASPPPSSALPGIAPSPASGGGSGWGRSLAAADAASVCNASDAPRPRGEETPAADPDQFVRQVWPQAEAAARELGLPTEVVVGHAALETGWGRHQPAGDSHNLFGIKADASWRGAKASSETREVRAGVEQTERADFRRYDSPADSIADYVRFLRGNPRYAQALAHGGDAAQFAQGLQKAGYATDPRYASKLLGVIERVRSLRAA
ncbi:flagellar assembly peptidoglycan hydrolase FlgJ [Stagnimonas aquatica]|uniref:Peptidoglycan hydrolase FlgJ n=1 Tax=Stagnimonas aquatica TaxID=2689987 RepID=A0A3N0V4Y1_9GAMM|nr:flagellar assembly peptidoglycan hydrolase FlgJ [Stagnimonas aquatica]ROH87763.1 flagellar assembly peptidoglycan hydrolase FlgJ [Stagnimonas aquatica]